MSKYKVTLGVTGLCLAIAGASQIAGVDSDAILVSGLALLVTTGLSLITPKMLTKNAKRALH